MAPYAFPPTHRPPLATSVSSERAIDARGVCSMRRLVAVVAVLGLALGAVACREEGTMEQAGKAVDEAVEDAAEAGEEAAAAGQQALEDAGEEVDEALEKAKKMAEGEQH